MRFKQFLKEARPADPEWFCKTRQEAIKLLYKDNDTSTNISYEVDNKYIAVKPSHNMGSKLLITENNMVQYGGDYRFGFNIWEVNNYLEIRVNGKIGSLIGLPQNIDKSVFLSASEIVFDFLPHMQNEMFAIGYDEECNLQHLKGIGKAKTVVGYVTLGNTIKSSILGLALFNYSNRGGKQVKESSIGNSDLNEACKIFCKHITDAQPGLADILEIQEDLITNGLKEYAKL